MVLVDMQRGNICMQKKSASEFIALSKLWGLSGDQSSRPKIGLEIKTALDLVGTKSF